MRKLSILLLLVSLSLLAVPLLAQETTPEPTVEVQPTAETAVEATAEATAEATEEAVDVPTAHIRIAHLSPDTPPVQTFINGEPSGIQVVSFGDVTGWVEVPVGTYSIALVPVDESIDAAVFGPADLSFATNAWVTLAATGSFEGGSLNVQVIAENYTGRIPLNQARLTIVHAVEGAPAVDVRLGDGTILVQGLEYTGVYRLDVDAASYDIQIVASGTDDVLLDLSGTEIEAGTFYFIAAAGSPDSPEVVLSSVQSGQVAPFLDSAAGTIAEIFASDPNFSTLNDALEAAGLADTLDGEGPFTVFAPVNGAFAAIPEADLNALLGDTAALSDVLSYHVVEGLLTSDDIRGGDSLTTLQGSDVTVSVSGTTLLVNDSAQIIILDMPASNGVIHAINAVLMPPSADAGDAGEGAGDSGETEAEPEATAEATTAP